MCPCYSPRANQVLHFFPLQWNRDSIYLYSAWLKRNQTMCVSKVHVTARGHVNDTELIKSYASSRHVRTSLQIRTFNHFSRKQGQHLAFFLPKHADLWEIPNQEAIQTYIVSCSAQSPSYHLEPNYFLL